MTSRVAALKPYAPLALRVGLAIVFGLFAMQKLAAPEQTRAEIQLLINVGLGSAAALNYYMGILELLIALGFLFGAYVRLVAIAASLVLIGILATFLQKYGASVDPNLYRDIGLLGACVNLWITGAGRWSVDTWRERRRRARLTT